MIVPSRLPIFVAIVLALLLLAALGAPGLAAVVVAADAILVTLCVLDGLRLSRLPVTVRRENDQRLQLGREATFTYLIENRSGSSLCVRIRQPWPASIEGKGLSVTVDVQPGEAVRAALSAIPHERGRITLPAAHADVWDRWGWARRRWRLDPDDPVTVYPDLQSLYEYDILRGKHALGQFGIHGMRLLGDGWEFEQLRDYVPDDDYRNINWKATARRRKPTTNVYRAEKSRDILLCVDCGRMMGDPVGEGTAFDRAVDAAIMLAHVAGRQSDRVGLALFRESVDLFLRPRAGIQATHRIIEELVGAQPEPVPPSYSELVSALRVGHKRRSMVFIFTDLNDPQLAADLARVLPLLSRLHLVVVVNLRDPLLDRVASGPADNTESAFQVLAARQLASERDARARELTKVGVQVLEADADSLTMDVINRYLSVKMRQLL